MSNRILVTGASGALGSQIVLELLKELPPEQVVALGRNLTKLDRVAQTGVELRVADYFDRPALEQAFLGIDQVFLVSALAFTDRFSQHKNVIDAAKAAGVRHLYYTSIMRRPDSVATITGVTDCDRETENYLKGSGLQYSILYHPLYTEVLPQFFNPTYLTEGLRLPAGSGKVPFTSRTDLAAAASALLIQKHSNNQEIILNSGQSYDFAELASVVSQITGQAIGYQPVNTEEFIHSLTAVGVPDAVAAFICSWIEAFALGDFDQPDSRLTQLIGRPAASLQQGLAPLLQSRAT